MANDQFLVIDDEPDGAEVVQLLLESMGAKCVVVYDAFAALDELQKDVTRFKAAVVDLALPEMDGFQFSRTVRQTPEFAHLPLIAVTAYHTPELRIKCLEQGFDAYFPKPLNTAIFSAALDNVLQSRS